MRWLPVVLLAACTPKTPPVAPAATPAPPRVAEMTLNPEAVAGVDDGVLRELLHDHWEDTMARSPMWATELGDHRYDDQLPHNSPDDTVRARMATRGFLERARAIDASALTPRDQTTLALFTLELQHDDESAICRFEQWSISPRFNPAVDFNFLPDSHPLDTEKAGLDLVARYQQLPRVVEEGIAQLRLGLADGLVANAETVRRVIEQIQTQLAEDPSTWSVASVVGQDRPTWGPQAVERFDRDILAAVSGPYKTALEGYVAFLETEVLPAARGADAVGLVALPNGAECYEARVRAFTTLPRDADAIHALGLEEMARIHDEFRALGPAVFESDDLATIFEHLRTDEALFFDDADEIMAKAESAVRKAEAAVPQAFGRLPETPVEVKEVPANEAPYTTIAYYWGPSADGTRPGAYYVNTYAPETRPRHEAEVLAFHEAVPGHHTQIAVASELEDLPAFRRHMGMTAFVEGWALYSERLADELGIYEGDVDRLGMLSFDSWRAARLVVDTGIHAKGWTREQAETYMLENTPLAPNNIENEVDRYISWPGQALAYKTGQLHIRALRAKAEEALGEDFDLRGFHDTVLGGGAVSLPELERQVDAWVASQIR